MILNFFYEQSVYEYPLPRENDKRIELNLNKDVDDGYGFINLVVRDGVWYLVSNEGTQFTIDGKIITSHALSAGDKFNCQTLRGNVRYAIRVFPVDRSYTQYEKFSLTGIESISIGRNSDCDVVITDKLVSRQHATIKQETGCFVLNDHSTSGTYVNGRRAKKQVQLRYLDELNIAGIKFIYMDNFIAINCVDKINAKLNKYRNLTGAVDEQVKPRSTLVHVPHRTWPLYGNTAELEYLSKPQNKETHPGKAIEESANGEPLPFSLINV